MLKVNLPREPEDALGLLIKDKKDDLTKKGITNKDKQKEACETMWEQFSDKEKKKYQDKEAAAKAKYDKDLAAYATKHGQAALTAALKAKKDKEAAGRKPKHVARGASIEANRINEVEILCSGFISRFYPRGGPKKAKWQQQDETFVLLADMLLECDTKIISDENTLNGITRALPQVDEAKDIDEYSKLAATWSGWSLNGDPATGCTDPLMVDADGNPIMDNQGNPSIDTHDGERPIMPERFMLSLLEIPNLVMRCDIFSKMLSHVDVVEEVGLRVAKVRNGLKLLRESKETCKLLQLSLAIGNFMTAKTKLGTRMVPNKKKFGIRLSALKSWNTKSSNDRKSNLLQYVIQFFDAMEKPAEDGLPFYHQFLPALKDAQKVNSILLDKDVGEMMADLEVIRVDAATVEKKQRQAGVDDHFHVTVEKFLADSKASEVYEGFKLMDEEFRETSMFLCFDPLLFDWVQTPMERFFGELVSLFGVYEEANSRILQRKRREEMAVKRAASKKAMEERKALAKAQPKKPKKPRKNIFGDMDEKMAKKFEVLPHTLRLCCSYICVLCSHTLFSFHTTRTLFSFDAACVQGGNISFDDQLKLACAGRKKKMGLG